MFKKPFLPVVDFEPVPMLIELIKQSKVENCPFAAFALPFL
jgi:hypothetical protein